MWATLIGFLGFENTAKVGMRVWAVTTLTAMVAALWAAGQVCANIVCGPVIQSISQSHPMFAVGLSLGFNPVTLCSVAHCWVRNIRVRNADSKAAPRV